MVRGGRAGVVGLAVTLAVVANGCGHRDSASQPQSPTNTSASEVVSPDFPTPTNTDVNSNGKPDSDPTDTDWPGKMTVVYGDATTPDAIRGRKFMQDNNLLPQLADDINETLKLPYDVPLKGTQCDEPNDYWSASDQAMILCYEDIANSLDIYQGFGDKDPDAGTFHEALAAFYHETGHMTIDLYDLPAVGREEDVADQASVYLLLRPGDDGKIDQDSVDAIMDSSRWFAAMSTLNDGEVDDATLADVHSPSRARMFNMVCWAYGADPEATGDVVAQNLLPADRAERCADEYQKLDRAWSTLLGPYLK
ncbi:DUF4344 domain-containing metallopeptidase [Mycolicibacterium komossense]|uniref:DUF4344 domain-containing metallopeptidase n=1 Tax=Mycolicibacterium komossense TaxID=1779 RepID=A0ABT3CBT8_9MYCO|nr:DUF4344 domain-containing metallopeptidase [Mycolicibacterium komossense]MCV7226949.1 DUF4344 domain-containing metallopeptidase [Mycolicibacterium komossense]